MEKRIIYIKDKLELLRIKRILELNSIEFELIDREDSAFKGISGSNSFELIINENDFDKIQNVSKENLNTKKLNFQENAKSKFNFWTVLILIYSLVITLLFMKYFNIAERGSVDKNFNYVWNYNNTILFQKYKKTEEIFSKYFDTNRDGNYEKIEGYNRGKLISISEDKNENGLIEKTVSYTYDKTISLTMLDNNEDGNYERMEGHIKGKLTSISEDKNENGFYEKNESFDLNGKVSVTNLDINEDGIFEKAVLIDENGRKLKLIDSDHNGSFKIIE